MLQTFKNISLVFIFYILNTLSTFGIVILERTILKSNNVYFTIASLIITIINIYLLLLLSNKTSLKIELNRSLIKSKNLRLILSFLLFKVSIDTIFSTILVNQGIIETANNTDIINTGVNWNLVVLLAVGVFQAPIAEELIYRGVIMSLILKKYPKISILVSALCFGFVHSYDNIFEYLNFAFSGFIYSFLFYKTKKLELCIMLHIVNNLLGVLLLYLRY